ncbi:MAG TPA: hypothetical protein VG916_12915 [Gemmatimonadaceae bacterium]|nr:hypothetical protein [Gemmatimonadaceae bacterium]
MKRLLDTLEDAGVVETLGRGAQQSYRLRQRLQLAGNLRQLFVEEQHRAHRIFDGIRSVLVGAGAAVRSAWIEGPAADDADRIGDVITVVVVPASHDDETLRLNVRDALNRLQSNEDVAVEVRYVHGADLEAMSADARARLRDVRQLVGPPPSYILEPGPAPIHDRVSHGTHQAHDERLLARARQVAERLRRDPSMIDRAREYIERRMTTASPGERLELSEWRDILDTSSPARVRRFLTSTTDRATRLRQSLPFLDDGQ